MSMYRELSINPPTIRVKKDPREVILTTISCMCDNKGTLKFKKNSEGDFKMSGGGFALSNWQMKHDRYDIEWMADENDWDQVIRMINTGTAVVSAVRSR